MQILNRYIYKNWGVERKENIQIKEYDTVRKVFICTWDDSKGL